MASPTAEETEIDPELLPDRYDALVSVENLVHGDHNPRRVRPKDTLRASIRQNGLNQPLIVRAQEEEATEVYHITDGWQRYQVATDCGWERLPVRIHTTRLAALEAAETESIVREWGTYEWARHCESLATAVGDDAAQSVATAVAERTARSAKTVRRYLDVLSLPREIHPLLIEGPEGTDQQWAALQHYNQNVKQYDGLSWLTAARLAREQEDLPRSRVVGIAARAVEFESVDESRDFVDRAVDQPEIPLQTVRKRVLLGTHHERYLEIPSVTVSLPPDEKKAIMEYCHQTRQSLTGIVAENIERLASDVSSE